MKFSVCIPNYNYERYIGRTIRSVLDQSHQDLEVLVSDNASTDRSVEVARSTGDPRVQLRINVCNVGFAGNVERAAHMASGDRMIMLSSDDLMRPGALEIYQTLNGILGEGAEAAIVSATMDVIDSDDNIIGRNCPNPALWREGDRSPELEAVLNAPVYRVSAEELLRRCLAVMKNPFNFAATAYPHRLYEKLEGYGSGRLINPDKWFHWRLLGVAKNAYFVDRPLFAYRWHAANQTAQEGSMGSLKYLVDEYTSTLEIDEALLDRVGITRSDLAKAFIEHDILNHGLATLGKGHRRRARRILDFGRAAYPQHLKRNWKVPAYRTLLSLGPLGVAIARRAYASRYTESQRGWTQ